MGHSGDWGYFRPGLNFGLTQRKRLKSSSVQFLTSSLFLDLSFAGVVSFGAPDYWACSGVRLSWRAQ